MGREGGKKGGSRERRTLFGSAAYAENAKERGERKGGTRRVAAWRLQLIRRSRSIGGGGKEERKKSQKGRKRSPSGSSTSPSCSVHRREKVSRGRGEGRGGKSADLAP